MKQITALFSAFIVLIGAILSTVVIMCMSLPKTHKEMFISTLTTVIFSMCFGSAVIHWYGLDNWSLSPFGTMGQIGIAFLCGLPGWACIRWCCAYFSKKYNASIDEIIKDLREKL